MDGVDEERTGVSESKGNSHSASEGADAVVKGYALVCALGVVLVSVALNACSSAAARADPPPVRIAKHEMQRSGWKGVQLDRCEFRDGLWVVVLYHKSKIHGGRSYVTVKVAPDGTIKDIIQDLE
jgi:hypothetical protein